MIGAMVSPTDVRQLLEEGGFGLIEERWGEGRKPARFCALSATLISANG